MRAVHRPPTSDIPSRGMPGALTLYVPALRYWRGQRALRQAEDSRFVGLTLPRVLMRLPYGTPGAPRDPIGLREDVEGAIAS